MAEMAQSRLILQFFFKGEKFAAPKPLPGYANEYGTSLSLFVLLNHLYIACEGTSTCTDYHMISTL